MTSEPVPNSEFRPAWWLRNGHAQTILSSFNFSGDLDAPLIREKVELPDGDIVVADWVRDDPNGDPASPILIALPGLEGSSASSYARRVLNMALDHGWRVVLLNFRDCGGYRNRLPRRYHSGETVDIAVYVDALSKRYSAAPLVAVGFSLGGNVLLKHLGEIGSSTPLKGAVSVCAPLDLHDSSAALSTGASRFYQWLLLRKMKEAIHRKFDKHTAPFQFDAAIASKSFDAFDDVATAPVHGFQGRDHYYDSCSSFRYVGQISKPTLIISALDDPFMTPAALPDPNQLPPSVNLEISARGGHVGFISGGFPLRPKFFLPKRVIDYLDPLVT